MPLRSSFSEAWSEGSFVTDPLAIKPTYDETLGALFRTNTQRGATTLGLDRFQLETGAGTGAKMSIQQANEKYGLKLKPTFTNTISTELAESFQRKELQRQLDEAIIQQGQPDILTQFGVGVAASLADPIEFTVGALLPFHKFALAANLSARAGRYVAPSVAERFFARGLGKTALNNPFVAGGVENALQQAAITPGNVLNSQALGKDYTAFDGLMDIAAAGTAGSLLQGLPSLLLKRSGIPPKSIPIDHDKAMAKAQADMAAGRPVDLSQTLDRQKIMDDLAETRRQAEQAVITDEDTVIRPEEPFFQGYDIPGESGLPPVSPTDLTVNDLSFKPFVHGSPKPRVGGKVPQFESDLDKALYIVANRNVTSGADDKFLQFAREALPGLSDDQIIDLASDVKKRVVQIAKGSEGDSPTVPKTTAELLNKKYPPAPKPVDMTPEMERHTTPLEKTILTEPHKLPQELSDTLSDLHQRMGELAELMTLSPAKKIEALSDIRGLESHIEQIVDNINSLLPERDQITGVDFTKKLNKNTLKKLGKEIERIKDYGAKDIDPETKLKNLQSEHTALSAEVKKYNQYLEQAKKKGHPTVEKWQAKLAEAVPKLEALTQELRALGEEAPTTELSIRSYLDATPGISDKVIQLVDELNVGRLEKKRGMTLDDPLYRLRGEALRKVMSRVKNTERFVSSLDLLGQKSSAFPDTDKTWAEVNAYLAENPTVDPDALIQTAAQAMDKQIKDLVAIGALDENQAAMLEKVEQDFKDQMSKVSAVKKGSIAAQICALGGIGSD